jgi:hypothetical protein
MGISRRRRRRGNRRRRWSRRGISTVSEGDEGGGWKEEGEGEGDVGEG